LSVFFPLPQSKNNLLKLSHRKTVLAFGAHEKPHQIREIDSLYENPQSYQKRKRINRLRFLAVRQKVPLKMKTALDSIFAIA
jgi:hypothetical protein